MSARLPELQVLSLEDTVAAAERICRHPSCNVQRVSMDETLSLALIARQYRQLGTLAARHLTGADPTPARLVEHLRASGFLAPLPTLTPEDINHG